MDGWIERERERSRWMDGMALHWSLSLIDDDGHLPSSVVAWRMCVVYIHLGAIYLATHIPPLQENVGLPTWTYLPLDN